MSNVSLVSLPKESALNAYVKPADFIDCYAVESSLSAREAAEQIVEYPAWVRSLMLLRRIVTEPFGLKNEIPTSEQSIGAFPIESETHEEIVAGFDDKHLNFRISIMVRNRRAFLATWVQPHNLGGQIYLATVMPFHILICKNALQRVVAAS